MADYADTVPALWLERGGVILAVYEREAMRLSFSADVPLALKIGVGKVCAPSGTAWSDVLSQSPQNYVAVPLQPWLDGISSGDGKVRQFAAVRHGLGTTVEGRRPAKRHTAACRLPFMRLRQKPGSDGSSGRIPSSPRTTGRTAQSIITRTALPTTQLWRPNGDRRRRHDAPRGLRRRATVERL